MKKHILGFALILAVLTGCSSKKSTNPDNPPTGQLLATVTIDAAGGILQTDDFQLTVPDGAFAESTTVALYAAVSDEPIDSIHVSRMYRLDGLPDNYAKPLRVAIRYTGTLAGTSAIAYGWKVADVRHPDSVIQFFFEVAADSSGFLLAELPVPPTVKSATADEEHDRYLQALSRQNNMFSAHFYAMLQKPFWEVPLLEHLEDAYARFTKLGFRYPPDEKPLFDDAYIDVYIDGPGRFDFDVPGEGSDVVFGNYHLTHLKFNAQWVWGWDQPEAPEIGPCVSRVFAEMTGEMYDPRHDSLTHFWLTQAFALWAEELLSTYSIHIPSQFRGHEMEPFRGIFAGVGPDVGSARFHGYGMAALLKYYAMQWSDAVDSSALALMWDRIRLQNFSLPQAVTMVDQERSIDQWWPDFFKEYIGGSIYNVPIDTFLNHRSGVYSINGRGDSLARYTTNYADLSAKLYGVGLSTGGFDVSSTIILGATASMVGPGTVKVVAFKVKPGQAEFLDMGSEVAIANPLALANEGWNLLVAVVNSHFGEPAVNTSVTFQVRVTSRTPLSAMEYGTVRFGIINYTYKWVPDTCTSYPGGAGSMFYYNNARGSVSGNVFSGVVRDTVSSDTWGHYIRHWWVTIAVDTILMTASFVVNDTIFDFDTPSTIYQTSVGSAIPVQPTTDGTFQFYFEGDICTKLTWQYYQVRPGTCDRTLESYSCSQPSAIAVELRPGY